MSAPVSEGHPQVPESAAPKFDRRQAMTVAASAALAGWAGLKVPPSKPGEFRGPKSSVVVLKAASYSAELTRLLVEGIRQTGLTVAGRKILLKPNLVEFDRSTAINTDVAMVMAAYEAFRTLGAAEVRIGEGPGHRRDTYDLAREARYRGEIEKFDDRFVDLNRDDVSRVERFADEPEIYLPNTALAADLVVSLPKMKTHHWAGATLAMKNFFGLVPGAVYGWPKNLLHHIGISRSIVELNRIFRRSFAIVDGIVGMEGNGPIQGTPKPMGLIVMGADLRAVDATCCRLMGIDPAQVEYLKLASALGHLDAGQIEQRGEPVAPLRSDFRLIHEFAHLRLPASEGRPT
jgi:uncharacterized protein (DUF362 family)